MSVPDPPAHQVEVENLEAATTNTNEADDIVMAEANVEPVPSPIPEANAENAPEASDVQPEATVAATAPVLPPRPCTIEQAYNHGELITVRWPFWSLRLLSLVLSLIIMLSIGLRSRSQSQDCQGFQVLPHLSGPSMQMASKATTHSLTARRTPTRSQEYHQIGSGVISSEAITPVFCMIKGAFSLICASTLKPLLECRA